MSNEAPPLTFTTEELDVLWQALGFIEKCGTSYLSAPREVLASLTPKIQSAAVGAGLVCAKHPTERVVHDPSAQGHPGWRDHVSGAFWPILPGTCFRCCAEEAQSRSCPICRGVIRPPKGRNGPIPKFCADCEVGREDMTAEQVKAADDAVAQRDRELVQIRRECEDREQGAVECLAGRHAMGPSDTSKFQKCLRCGKKPRRKPVP